MIWVVEQPQDKDGLPHFCYYDPTVDLQFAWDGFALEIDVSRDDKVVDRMPIPVGYHSAARNPGRWLAWFEVQCQLYIKEKEHESTLGSPDPTGVRRDRVGSSEEESTTTQR